LTGLHLFKTVGVHVKMTTDSTIKRPFYLATSTLTVLICTVLTVFNLTEWYKIQILEKIGGYPFGGEGPTPYFYETAEMYSTVCLIWGLLFLTTLTFTTMTLLKRQKEKTVLSFGLTLFLLATMFVHGQIGTN